MIDYLIGIFFVIALFTGIGSVSFGVFYTKYAEYSDWALIRIFRMLEWFSMSVVCLIVLSVVKAYT